MNRRSRIHAHQRKKGSLASQSRRLFSGPVLALAILLMGMNPAGVWSQVAVGRGRQQTSPGPALTSALPSMPPSWDLPVGRLAEEGDNDDDGDDGSGDS
jgi:hypothetical protein